MGIRWNRLGEAVQTSTHSLCFEQKYEKISEFLSKNFQFLVEKFSIYLNRHVFIMFLLALTEFCERKPILRYHTKRLIVLGLTAQQPL